MKLLLTSGGLRNTELKKALLELTGTPASKIKMAFIPSAMHVEVGDKSWVVDQLHYLKEMNIAQLDIVDIAAIAREVWLPRLQESNVIFVNGGNTTFLMKCFNESGLTKEIPSLLDSRVYVGVSAGSYIATPDTRLNSDENSETLDALGLVEFGIQAHLNSPQFPLAKDEKTIRKRLQNCPYTVHALDDQTGIKINGNTFEFVGTGEHITFNATI
ncbi:MAG: Type 1 glutamine amidotransferase-like domain-containing protein [Candidatus Saccharimonadales bacterium]